MYSSFVLGRSVAENLVHSDIKDINTGIEITSLHKIDISIPNEKTSDILSCVCTPVRRSGAICGCFDLYN